MSQLFYNIAGGIVHQIRREKRTISEVIVRGKRNIKQFRNFLLIATVLFHCSLSKKNSLFLKKKSRSNMAHLFNIKI